MIMETKANHILIGLFVLIATTASFVFVYWVKGESMGGEQTYYDIVFEGGVGGLSTASGVLFNGMRVGRVTDMRIEKADSRKVRVRIAINPKTPVRSNSYARIEQQGLTGISVVQISPGTPDRPIVIAELGDEYPVIAAQSGAGASLYAAAPELLNNANALILRVNDLIAHNEQSVHNTVRNAEKFSRILAGKATDIDTLIADVSKAAARLEMIAGKADKFIDANSEKLGKTITNIEGFTSMLDAHKDDVGAIIVEVRKLSARFNQAALVLESTLNAISGILGDEDGNTFLEKLSAAVEAFRQMAEKLDEALGDNADDVAQFAKRGLQEFELFMADGREAALMLGRLLEKIERNPQAFIFGGQQVPEYDRSDQIDR
jgi:phospholipid/cholesterol/gamma-HCH transport system substrate-binding protein